MLYIYCDLSQYESDTITVVSKHLLPERSGNARQLANVAHSKFSFLTLR